MIIHKNTEFFCVFCMLMEYESRLIQYFIELVFMSHESSKTREKVYRICFYECSLNMSVDSWKNIHETFIELTPGRLSMKLQSLRGKWGHRFWVNRIKSLIIKVCPAPSLTISKVNVCLRPSICKSPKFHCFVRKKL